MHFKIKVYLLSFLGILMMSSAFAQLTPSNNLGIFPPPGPFNPNGKFTSIGESGGVVGPVNGCDLYGFRAQLDPVTAVNLGMEIDNGRRIPALTFEAQRPFIIEQRNSSGNGSGPLLGCGKALAWYFDSSSSGGVNDIVYRVFGSGLASGFWLASDRRLKRNISAVSDPIDILQQMNGVTYEFRRDEYPDLNLRAGIQYGFIAQEVQEVMPEAIQTVYDIDGNPEYLSVNYDMVIPVLTEAIKVQDQLIQDQNDRLQTQQTQMELLEARMAQLEQLVLQNNNKSTAVTLRQNRPNPFSGLTTIEYDLPLTMDGAQLVVYDMRGVELERIAIGTGVGSVNYDASDLSSGVYFYLIEHNGQNVARQKMVIK